MGKGRFEGDTVSDGGKGIAAFDLHARTFSFGISSDTFLFLPSNAARCIVISLLQVVGQLDV